MTQTKYSISTYDGEFFDFKNPEGYDYSILEIVHALSNICRYGGHSNRFYSVAEHSVIVSKLVPSKYALIGLLHDASEAFVGDMPSPLKALCPEYREIEGRVHRAIAKAFDLPYPFPPEIKLADKQAYRAEREQITTVADNMWYTDIPPADINVQCLCPELAHWQFLQRFNQIKTEQLEAA